MMKKVAVFVGLLAGLVMVGQLQSADSLKKADMVVFSYDRPLQLYAFLESTQKYITGIGQLSIIYRASNESFKKGYEEVRAHFPRALFYVQGDFPAHDFKPLTLKAAFESPSAYILFAVDDIVVKDTIDLNRCIDALERYSAYAFFLRLGKNLNYCYSLDKVQPVPPLKAEETDIYSWRFSDAIGDWGYPHTVDLTLYRKRDIKEDFKTISYTTPNRLEGAWSSRAHQILTQKGLCFTTSKMVNLPLNRVQHDYQNRAMKITVQELQAQFEAGKKIDIAKLDRIENRSAHMEYVPTFIDRNEKGNL